MKHIPIKRTLLMLAAFGLIVAGPVAAEISQEDFQKALAKYLETENGRKTVGSAVETYFKTRQEGAKKEQAQRAAAEMENQFKNPVKIPVGNSPIKGPEDAKITIIEFSDFQCPYCSRADKTMQEVLKAYPKDVRLVFKNLPLPFHKQAEPAARAALAAGKQGKFWEMHDAMFKNQRGLNTEFFNKTAADIGIDVEKFKKDFGSEEVKQMVKDDADLARKHGIRGTPGFFVNGVAVKGAYPFDHFKKIIDRWLKETA